MEYLRLVYLILACLGSGVVDTAIAGSNPIALHRDLFANLDKTIEPYLRTGRKLNVRVGISILRIDPQPTENGDFLRIYLWLTQMWKDTMLMWEPSRYGNITQITLPASSIWTPDLTAYSSANAEGVFPSVPPSLKVVVTFDGTVTYLLPHTVIVGATYTGNNGEFTLKYGSWATNGNQMDLNNDDTIDLTEYTAGKCLDITAIEIKKESVQYACCAESYIDVKVVGKVENKC